MSTETHKHRELLPSYLTEDALDALIARALEEDVGPGDVTTRATVGPDVRAEAHLQAKDAGIVAGLAVAKRVFHVIDTDVEVTWISGDGNPVEVNETIAAVSGRIRSLLTAERLALNFIQRMSGIATATHHMVEAARPHGTQILDTRKTAPGLRLLDKWAVYLGGGTNHRLGLYDQVLIKDNHIAAAGGVSQALDVARRYCEEHDPSLTIEIETRTLDEVRAVLDADAVDVILLDNMAHLQDDGTIDVSRLQEAIDLIDGRCRTEASGNVTLETVPAIAATGVDAISSGALTHSVQALDISMTIDLGDKVL